MLVQKRRNTVAALKLLRKLLKNQGIHPETTDKLASYRAASESSAAEIATDLDACSATIGLRTPIWSFDDGSANNRNSNLKVQSRGSSPRTPPSSIPSMFNVTLSAEPLFA